MTKRVKMLLATAALFLAMAVSYSFAESCSASLECPMDPVTLSCSVTAPAGGTTLCWEESNRIFCCAFDAEGNLVQDIHKQCPGGSGGPFNPNNN